LGSAWSFVAGRGTFNVYLESDPGLSWSTAVYVDFVVGKALEKKGECICEEIKIVQYVKSTYDFQSRGWHLDNGEGPFTGPSYYEGQRPFYAQQYPWTPGLKHAQAYDYPGPTWFTRSRYDILSQVWRVYAACTKGKEANRSYGYTEYGIDYEFWGSGLIWRWIEGVGGHASGPPGAVPGLQGVGLAPLPGYIVP